MTQVVVKQPADTLDYDVDFSKWLPDEDRITTAVAKVDVPSEMSVKFVNVADQVVKVWVDGGLNGSTYKVTVTASTFGGRIKEADFKIRVREF